MSRFCAGDYKVEIHSSHHLFLKKVYIFNIFVMNLDLAEIFFVLLQTLVRLGGHNFCYHFWFLRKRIPFDVKYC